MRGFDDLQYQYEYIKRNEIYPTVRSANYESNNEKNRLDLTSRIARRLAPYTQSIIDQYHVLCTNINNTGLEGTKKMVVEVVIIRNGKSAGSKETIAL